MSQNNPYLQPSPSVTPAAGQRAAGLSTQSPRQIKLGERIAMEIKQEILQKNLTPGAFLGTLPELMAYYGISRATLREATRQLERQGIVTIKRGVSGGLVVQQPATDAAKFALANHLEMTQTPLPDLFEFRLIIEEAIIRRAIRRITEQDKQELRALIEEPQQGDTRQEVKRFLTLGQLLGRIAGNPALSLLLEAVNRVTVAVIPEPANALASQQMSIHFRERKTQQILAIIDGDTDTALRINREDNATAEATTKTHLAEFESQLLGSNHQLHQVNPNIDSRNVPERIAHRLAVTMSREIIDSQQLPAGTHLGCEPDLLKKYGVSRSTFREAVRLLELHQIVQTRRGNNGGLVVGIPDSTYTIDVVTTYFQYIKLRRKHMFELWWMLLEGAAPLAAKRRSQTELNSLQRLYRQLELLHGEDFMTCLGEMHWLLIECCHNRVLSLITALPKVFARAYQQQPPTDDVRDLLLKTHYDLIQAIVRSDAGEAVNHILASLAITNQYWSSDGKSLQSPQHNLINH